MPANVLKKMITCSGECALQRRGNRRHFNAILLIVPATLAPIAAALAQSIGPPVQIGTISASVAPEVSGIVDGRATPNTFWIHNDSGDTARFFAINHQGALLGTFPLANASAVDWEDIAIGGKPGGGNYLYLGDIGDNNANRPSITVYRIDEPRSTVSATIPAGGYSAARLQYPNGPRNAESLFVDPLTNNLFIITKTAIPEIYSVPPSAFDNPMTTMTALGTLNVTLVKPTAADISPDGREILVRSKSAAYLFERSIGQSVADALHGIGIPFVLGSESQGEAIGWAAEGTGFYTTSESNGLASAPIHYYTFTEPAPDYNSNGVVDAADYVVWRKGLGTQAEYDNWRSQFGALTSGTGASISLDAGSFAVPEPMALRLVGTAFLVAAVSRRRPTGFTFASTG